MSKTVASITHQVGRNSIGEQIGFNLLKEDSVPIHHHRDSLTVVLLATVTGSPPLQGTGEE